MVTKRWSIAAFESLKEVFDFHSDNLDYAQKVVYTIFDKVDSLQFTEQYQVDEILGES